MLFELFSTLSTVFKHDPVITVYLLGVISTFIAMLLHYTQTTNIRSETSAELAVSLFWLLLLPSFWPIFLSTVAVYKLIDK